MPHTLGNFLGDTKAVLNGCKDHWTLQDRAAMPLLYKITICVDIRVVVPGAWVAFSYRTVYAPRPELGLEGDDEAIYGWLLGVRHQFPLQLSPTLWHRVCLRRDVKGNTFSLEVDGHIVTKRTVIAQAIPPSGSLWLGCRPNSRPPESKLGKVELYLFRVWGDLGDHGLCEDGTVIGWNAQYWGVTSPGARQIDHNLLCDHKRLKRGIRVYRSATDVTASGGAQSLLSSSVSSTQSLSATVSPETTDHIVSTGTTPPPLRSAPPVNTSSANQISTSTPVPSIKALPANQSTPGGLFTSGSPRLVKCDARQLCSNKSAYYWMPISIEGNKTQQDVYNMVVEVSCRATMNISHTACDVVLLLSYAVSACELQRAGDSALQQAGGLMQATIIGEVERIGRNLCEDVEPSSGGFVRCNSTSSLDDICQSNKSSTLTCFLLEPNSNLAPQTKTDSCSSQFYTFRININNNAVNIQSLKNLLLKPATLQCPTSTQCNNYNNIIKQYQGVHLECHGTSQRLYSCMVILEMSGPVDVCSLKQLVQQIFVDNSITAESSPTRLMVCGTPGLPISTLLDSNLTWVASDLLSSHVCQSDPTLLTCEASETLAVLLTDSCPSDTSAAPSTTQPSTLTNSITTANNSVTNTSGDIYATTKNTAQKPENTTGSQAATSAQSSTAQPVLQTGTMFNYTTVQNALSSETRLANTMKNANNMTVQNTTAVPDSMLNTSSNYTTLDNATTAGDIYTTAYSSTTPTKNDTAMYNAATAVNNATKASSNRTTLDNATTAGDTYKTAYSATTTGNSDTAVYNATTAGNNYTTAYSTTAPGNNYNATTVGNNYTPMYNATTAANQNDTVTASGSNYTTAYNETSAGNNYTTAYSGTTLTKNYTAMYNASTAGNNLNVTTTNQNYTTVNNATTLATNFTIVYNATTASSNRTTLDNATTAGDTYTTAYSATTPSKNDTAMYNATTAGKSFSTTTANNNYTTVNSTTTAGNNYNTTTASNNHKAVNNATTAGNNYTAPYSTTAPGNNYNATTAGNTFSTTTTNNNYTTVNSTTTAGNNYNATTASNNYTAMNNATTAGDTYTTAYSATTPSKNDTAI
ncbi:adhesion G-protein coupled receptor G4-like [Archocentrus centrarchus]|uniref:adhesion G-protein coupled receptor G4-like n=1 Tax=Archocentrus centrarchus TaxID=63155 RepID=UPI0011EA49CB|nr:adhesion G-protein coupled receptor G4-like [Archocentrus centrarchus]